MNEKSSCPHRLESLLAQRYPIFVGQLFDDGLLALRARDERPKQCEPCRAGLVVHIGIELPQPGLLVDLARPDDGRLRPRVAFGYLLRQRHRLVARAGVGSAERRVGKGGDRGGSTRGGRKTYTKNTNYQTMYK